MGKQWETATCPFLHEVVMVYCGAYPVRKLIPKQKYPAGVCFGAAHSGCPYFNEMAERVGQRFDNETARKIAAPLEETSSRGDCPASKTIRERRRRLSLGLQKVNGFLLHPGFFYHRRHMWVMPCTAGMGRVGLDDFGARLLDDVRAIALPVPGSTVRRDEVAVALECGEKRVSLPSPVGGLVAAVNENVARKPSALMLDPYGEGWLFAVELDEGSLAELQTGSAAAEWLRRDADRLSALLGAAAADGGELIRNPSAVLTPERWEKVVHTFFLPARPK